MGCSVFHRLKTWPRAERTVVMRSCRPFWQTCPWPDRKRAPRGSHGNAAPGWHGLDYRRLLLCRHRKLLLLLLQRRSLHAAGVDAVADRALSFGRRARTRCDHTCRDRSGLVTHRCHFRGGHVVAQSCRERRWSFTARALVTDRVVSHPPSRSAAGGPTSCPSEMSPARPAPAG